MSESKKVTIRGMMKVARKAPSKKPTGHDLLKVAGMVDLVIYRASGHCWERDDVQNTALVGYGRTEDEARSKLLARSLSGDDSIMSVDSIIVPSTLDDLLEFLNYEGSCHGGPS